MQIFLFPLGQTVFFPGTSKPLNIFEPRYLRMVEDSLRTDTPIGIGYVDEGVQNFEAEIGECPSFVRSILGIGKPQIVEKREDGTLLVFIQSLGKVEIGPVVASETPYLVCEAQLIEEAETISAEWVMPFTTLNKLLGSWIARNIPEPLARDQFMEHIKTPKEVIGCFSAFLVLDPDSQQAVLEANSIDGKISLLSGLIAGGEILK